MRILFSFIGLALYLATVIATSGCEWPASHPPLSDANHLPFNLVDLDLAELPTLYPYLHTADRYSEPLDADSIEMFAYRGKTYYHPIYMMHRTQTFIGKFWRTGDSTYLQRAEQYYRKLLSLARRKGDAIFFVYPFTFEVHGDTSYTMKPPWYSGMAQGIAVRVASRLFRSTGDSTFLFYADSTFNSFLHLDSTDGPVVARLDSAGFYWIEEYPHPMYPGMTLNGFVAAVIGIYEYYLTLPTPEARRVLECCLTTLKNYLPQYRQRDNYSLYCLGHRSIAHHGYHRMHIEQMIELQKLSGDPFFGVMADIFKADAASLPPETESSSKTGP